MLGPLAFTGITRVAFVITRLFSSVGCEAAEMSNVALTT
jgi:hypothetical protein